MSASAVASRAAVRSPARPSARRARAHRPARPVPPQTPADFYSRKARMLLADLLATRAECWLADSMPPLYFYGRDSTPVWDESAGQRISGTTLRIAGRRVLFDSLSMDLERGLRLLTLTWTPEKKTVDGHDPEEWQAALAGVFWRVGQHYRELVRRKGEEVAQETLRQVMGTLWK